MRSYLALCLLGSILTFSGICLADPCKNGCFEYVCFYDSQDTCYQYRTSELSQTSYKQCFLGWYPANISSTHNPHENGICTVKDPIQNIYRFICSDCDPECSNDGCYAVSCTECVLSDAEPRAAAECKGDVNSGTP